MPEIRLNRTVDGVAPPTEAEERRMQMQSKKRLRADRYLWGIYIMILIFSIVELFSASSTEVKSDNVYSPLISHVIFLLIGFGLVCLMQNIHYKYYRKSAWAVFWLSLGLVIYSTYFGININGAVRAIRVAGFTVQPRR